MSAEANEQEAYDVLRESLGDMRVSRMYVENEDNISVYFEDMYNRLPEAEQATTIPTLQAVTARIDEEEEDVSIAIPAQATGHFSHAIFESEQVGSETMQTRPQTACAVRTVRLKKRPFKPIKLKAPLQEVVEEEAKYLTHQLKG